MSHPVTKYIDIWGDSIGMIGGIDMDKMARFEKNDLKSHRLLCAQWQVCLRYGKNTVSNYMPVENYLLLINECQNGKG